MVSDDFSLKKFYLIPWFLGFTFIMGLMTYQFTYTYVELFWNKDAALQKLLNFFHSEYLIPFLITGWIFLILYFLLSPIFEVWLVHKINCKSQNIDLDSGDAIWKWMLTFRQIFDFNNTFDLLKFLSIFNIYLFSIRFVGLDYIKPISLLFIALFVIWLVVNILFSYAKYYIILDWEKTFRAVTNSVKLSTVNIAVTIKLFMLMFILNLRVLINLLIFLLIPSAIIWTISLVSSQFIQIVAVWILTIFWIWLYLLTMYLSTVLEIFKSAVWYFAYKDCKANMKVIDDSVK
jgi:hypothetical protein